MQDSFTSLILWLEAKMFMKVHEYHSLTKHISASCGKTANIINTLKTIYCSNILKEDAYIKRD